MNNPTQTLIDNSLALLIPIGEATELPPDAGWMQWELAVRIQQLEGEKT